MFSTSSVLADFLAPVSPELFFREKWEKEPLAVHRHSQKYAGLFSLDDLEAVISFTRPRFTDASVFQSPGPQSPTYLRGVLAERPAPTAPQPSVAELRQLYDQGKSVVIMAMQRRWPAVAELCRNLEAVFRCPVHANLYLTPAQSQGFAAHFDTHEVFVLQLEGVKRWRLFGPGQELPLADDAMPLARRPGKPREEVELRAGDLLYIPRGHVHEAATDDAQSLHLTLGVNVYRWADLLHHALNQMARRNVALRSSLPGGALPDDTRELKAQFQSLVAQLADSAQDDGLFEEALGSLGDQFFGQLEMLPCGQFGGRSSAIALDTSLVRRIDAICRVLENDEGVAIEFPGNRVAGPPRIGAALRFIAQASSFTARDLPGELSDEARLVLVRRLMREGLLQIAAPPVANDDAGRLFFPGATFLEDHHVDDVTARQLAKAVGAVGGQGLVGRGTEAAVVE
ncbi:MAG TPA: cupin domain-containing protein [Pirellulales bacterium]|nr:cupin domain-containing protein [Pirellulales bacterium]